MTPDQYRTARRRLGLSHAGVARLFAIDTRTSRRWQSGEAPMPKSAALCLTLMVKLKLDPADYMDKRTAAPVS